MVDRAVIVSADFGPLTARTVDSLTAPLMQPMTITLTKPVVHDAFYELLSGAVPRNRQIETYRLPALRFGGQHAPASVNPKRARQKAQRLARKAQRRKGS